VKYIVKRAGHTESFDPKKLYDSIYAAARALHESETQAGITAQRVCDEVSKWIKNKYEVTSKDISLQAEEHLKVLHPEVADIYKTQRIFH